MGAHQVVLALVTLVRPALLQVQRRHADVMRLLLSWKVFHLPVRPFVCLAKLASTATTASAVRVHRVSRELNRRRAIFAPTALLADSLSTPLARHALTALRAHLPTLRRQRLVSCVPLAGHSLERASQLVTFAPRALTARLRALLSVLLVV